MDDRLKGLFIEYSRFVFAVCKRYSSDHEEAEDLTQEVFLLIGKKLAGFRGESRLSTWIYRIAINRCMDHLRWRDAQQRLVAGYLDEMVLRNLGCEDAVQAKIDLQKILSQANESTRRILFLSFAEGLTYQEVSEVMGTGAFNVAKIIQRFRNRILERAKAGDTMAKPATRGTR